MTAPAPVSVLITAWNAERFIGEAIRSALAQTSPPAEVVVVDDGSTDGTADVVRDLGERVQLISVAHAGIGAGRNHAMAAARQPVLAFLDADDRWRPTKLERQLAVLEAEDLDVVYCRTDEFLDGAPVPGQRPPVLDARGPLASGMLIRSEAAQRVGPFDPDLRVGDWIDWWGRVIDAGLRHAEVAESLVERRLHAANNSLRASETHEAQYLKVIRQRLERARSLRP